MGLCRHCGKRKAKRSCPALGSELCSLCCGTLRERELHCPPSCRTLAEHKPYQEKRVLERRAERAGRERRLDERLSWLAFTVETTLRELARRLPGITDRDAALAVAYAREKFERGQSLLVLPGAARRPQSETGEAVVRAIEECRFQPGGLITTGTETYTRDDRLVALDFVARTIQTTPGSRAEGRVYLQSLAARFDAAQKASRERKILTPG